MTGVTCALPIYNGEDFYVLDSLWTSTIPKYKQLDVICIDCFERRLGRKLKKSDFKEWFKTNTWYSNHNKLLNKSPSKKLCERLKYTLTFSKKIEYDSCYE